MENAIRETIFGARELSSGLRQIVSASSIPCTTIYLKKNNKNKKK